MNNICTLTTDQFALHSNCNQNQLVKWIINRCKLKSEREEARHNNKSLSKSSVSWQNQQPGRGNELKIDSRSATTERLNNYRHIRINVSVTSRWQDTLLCATNLLRKRFADTTRKSAAQKKCPQNLGMKKIVWFCPQCSDHSAHWAALRGAVTV